MMLNWLKSLPGRSGPTDTVSGSASSPAPPEVPGYHLPQSATALTATAARQVYVQQLWDNCVLPAEQYQQLYFSPLAQLLVRVQNVPAISSGPWSGTGGYGDMVVKYVTCAIRLAKAHLLPPGAAPEEQAAQGARWNAVVFWSALFYHLPLLSQFSGELRSGAPWRPGLSEPGEPFRFRFDTPLPPANLTQSTATLLACQLLPPGATSWLSTVPATLGCLAQRLCGLPSPLSVIDELLTAAAEKSGAVNMSAPAWNLSLYPDAGTTSPVPLTGVALTTTTDGYITIDTPQPADMLLSAQAVGTIPSLVSAVDDPVATERVAAEKASTETSASGDDMKALLALLEEPEEQTAEVARLTREGERITSPGLEALVTERVGIGSAFGQRTHEPVCAPDDATSPAQGVSEFIAGNDTVQPGEAFWSWLRDGIRSGRLPVNGPEDALQVVAGFVLIPVPGMFFRYLKDSGREGSQREDVQRAFELLNHHKRRDNRRFYFGRLYPSGDGSGTFTRTKGYLVKASLLFDRVPPDGPYLIIA